MDMLKFSLLKKARVKRERTGIDEDAMNNAFKNKVRLMAVIMFQYTIY